MERNPKRALIIVVIALAIIALAFYGYRQSRQYLRGPVIVVTEPEDGFSSILPLLSITGKAGNAAFLTLNGKQIFTDEQGGFSEKLLLQEGYNIITIAAKDRFGRTAQRTLELVHKPINNTESLIPNP